MNRSEELTALREKMGMNRKEFCDYYQIPYRTVVDWEIGKNSIPEYLLRLMEYKAYMEQMLDEGKILNRKLTDLEMVNKKDHKIMITEEAIKKVPFIEYPEVPKEQYEIIHRLAKKVLQISKEKNDSEEVALTYSYEGFDASTMDEPFVGVAIGGEHEVDPLSDSGSYHIIMSGKTCAVVTLHNHPSLTDFSLEDVRFLLQYPNIKLMVVVTNQGKISYLVKREKYKRDVAFMLFNEALTLYKKARKLKGLLKATDYFLDNCGIAEIIYGKR